MRVLAAAIILGASLLLALAVLSPPSSGDRRDQPEVDDAAETKLTKPAVLRLQANAFAIPPGALPGTIVCEDLPSVKFALDEYFTYLADQNMEKIEGSAARVLNGPPAPEPHIWALGCSLLEPGLPLEVTEIVPGVLRVRTKATDGHLISGVTLDNMILRARVGAEAPAPYRPPTSESSTPQGDNAGAANDPLSTYEAIPPKNKTPTSHPNCLYCPSPDYPAEARSLGLSGIVELSATVRPDGRATDITVVKSQGQILDAAAVATVEKWRFEPAKSADGSPTQATVSIQLTFRIQADKNTGLLAAP